MQVISLSMLAAFVTPGLAVAGGLAVAAPILIHLLARRRFKRIRWAAMDFLIDAERRNRRRVRMEEWILLLLRCLAVFLLGLIVARPFLSAAGLASKWGGSRRVERIILLDDSFSMGYESGEGSTFVRAQEAVRRLLDMIHGETPDDTVTLIRTSAIDAPLASSVYLNEPQLADLMARVDAAKPTQEALDLQAAFKAIAESLGRDPGVLSAAIYFISDFQRVDWSVKETEQASTEVTAPLAEWANKDRTLRAILVNVGDPAASNKAMVEARWGGGPIVAGSSTMLHATVANFSPRSADNLELHVFSGGRPQASKNLPSVGEQQSASLELPIDFPTIGEEQVRVELPADGLMVDNVRYAAAEVVPAIRVLLVNGEPSADDVDDEAMLLATALRPEGPLFSGHEVTVVDETGFEESSLSGFQLVILANLYRVSDAALPALERFVAGGGGLMIFLGDQVDPDAYNAALFRSGEGLLPAELKTVVGSTEPYFMSIVDRLHPALRTVSGENDPLGLRQIPFYGFFAVQAPRGEAEGGGSGSPSVAAIEPPASKDSRAPANVIAVFSDSENHPALIERGYGDGRVMVIASSADKEWNLWSYHPTYLPIMTEFVRYMARGAVGADQNVVGAPIKLDVDPSVFEPDIVVRGPAYPAEAEASITASSAGETSGFTAVWNHTAAAGVYQFILKRREGGGKLRFVAVNVDARESDLGMIDEASLKRSMGAIPHDYIQGLGSLSRGADDAKTEFWKAALVFVIITLMGEQFLAWHWGRKR